MPLTPHQSLMLEAACDEVLTAGKLYRQRRDQPLATEMAKSLALDRYTASTDYLLKLLRKIEAQHDQA